MDLQAKSAESPELEDINFLEFSSNLLIVNLFKRISYINIYTLITVQNSSITAFLS